MKKSTSQLLIEVIVLLVSIAIIATLGSKDTKAQTSIIPNDLALELARKYSMDDGLVGGALITPKNAYGQVMTYDEAILFVSGKSIDPSTQIFTKRDISVWLVILEGEFVSHVPASVDGAVPAKDVNHRQMAIIMDAKTGELYRRTLISPQIQLLPADLPTLQDSQEDSNFILPTQVPIATEIPYYQTLTP